MLIGEAACDLKYSVRCQGSELRGLGSSPGCGHCIVFLGCQDILL